MARDESRSDGTFGHSRSKKSIAVTIYLFASLCVYAQTTITVVGWNIESGDAVVEVIAERVAAMDDVDIWGFSEVERTGADSILEAAAEDGEDADFRTIVGSTGANDRLLIAYDHDRFELLGWEELHEINVGGRVRAPLVAHMRDRDSGTEFLFMVNHLYRSRPERRHVQSRMLNEWALGHDIPVIAVGDYNYDWEVVGGDVDRDRGFDLLTSDGVFTWVRPARLIRTQCSVVSTGLCRYDSVLDFVFIANVPETWRAESEIIVAPGDFPDDETTSDHRPVLGRVEVR
jgi:hypothetical protein